MISRLKPSLNTQELKTILLPAPQHSVEQFEAKFASVFGAKYAIAFPYGRSALWAFFKASHIENAEIIMPAYTCTVVAHAVVLSGNTPRFVDITLHDYNMDLDQVADAITERTQAIVATHLFGYPLDIDRLTEIVREAENRYGHKIWVIQDCAHSFGARWQGKLVCSAADCALFGLNISKTITSIFGGMFTTNDETLAAHLRYWRDKHFIHPGIGKSLYRRLYLLSVYAAFDERVYGFVNWLQENTPLLNSLTKAYHLDEKIHFPPGSLDQMLAIEAQVGLIQLQKYADIVKHRQKNARFYDEQLRERVPWLLPPIVEGATYSHYVVRVPDRQDVMRKMLRDGIELGQLIEYSIPHISVYSPYALNTEYPNSLISSQMTINLPLHKNIKKEHLIRITKLITDNFGVSSA
jgi:dTDP-4-amino-4,6-dideoxygalactose transaminase